LWFLKRTTSCPWGEVKPTVFIVYLISSSYTFLFRHNVDYECILIFKGRLQEEEQQLILKGRGSYDGRHENLVNVVTQF
jgi:hypothetical protein